MESHETMELTESQAVASIEEARWSAAEAMAMATEGVTAFTPYERSVVDENITTEGGQITLPDGTLIEVREVSWHDLIDAIGGGIPLLPETVEEIAEVIQAYNSNQ
jgi:hypothetical protein